MRIYLSNNYPETVPVRLALMNLSEALGLRVFEADYFRIDTPIVAQIMDGIKHSDIVIADISSENPNVYYEIGLAHAFGKPAILLTQSSQVNRFSLLFHKYYSYEDSVSGIKQLSLLLAHILSNPNEINQLRPHTPKKNILDYSESTTFNRLDEILSLTGHNKFSEFEKWIHSLLQEIPGFEVQDHVTRKGKEYDFIIWNSNEADELRALGNPIPIEVKASNRVENNLIHSLTSKASSQGFKSFVLITTASLSESNKKLLRELKEHSGIAILVVEREDLKAIASSKDLIRVLITSYRRFFIYR